MTASIKLTIRQDHAARGERLPEAAASATICGDGVSPAASAAASGSPPGRAAATASAETGRSKGSLCRQLRMTRAAAGSNPSTRLEGLAELAALDAGFPVVNS